MSNVIAYGRALLYPHINCTNESWIKMAALYYKGIDRIVPEGFDEFTDTEITKQFNENEEFISDLNPNLAINRISENFLDFAEKELKNFDKRVAFINNFSPEIISLSKYLIHKDKITYLLFSRLREMGLAKSIDVRSKGYVNECYEFEPLTGAAYMTFLANQLAENKNLPVVTDDPLFQSLIRIGQKDNSSRKDIGEVLATMVIESVIPINIEEISISKIMSFRSKYNDERHAFYNEINKLVKELEKANDNDVLQECLQSKKKDIDIAINNLKLSLKGIGISTTTGLIGVSIPTYLSGLGPEIVAAGAVVIAVGKLINQGIDYYKSKKNSPYAYVLSMKRNLKAETLAEQLWKGKVII